ncbi:MAG: oxidoreductase [Betaproteobacteria bacterium RIFCSPLOWO2_12_FULL_62_58]|nr:MAG: oxidoreductase [Betaproteobacteria bacterium RIFCSPLOWO2_12_FULL_62_58]
MNPLLSAVSWLGAYVVVVTAPLFALLLGPVPPPGGFWWDFAMALGFAALAMMGVQFILTARFRRATMPFGIDIVYYVHRFLAIFALAIAALHYLIIRIDNPAALGTANPLDAPAHMSAGRAAIVLFVLLVASSLARRRFGIDYNLWRWTHALIATIAFGLALWHVVGTGYYIDTDWKQALWTGYGLFWIALIGHVRVVRPWLMLRKPYHVAGVRRERGDAYTLVLEPEGHGGMRFQPGQFAWLTLGASPFALKEHPFSIASSAARAGTIEFGIKAVGDFTRSVINVPPGQKAFLDGPYGAFSTDRHPRAPGYVFVAGGVGIAPIMGMLRTLADRGDRRPLVLFYGNRCWERTLYREEPDALAGRLNLRIIHILGEPPEGWDGERGLLTQAMLERHLPADRAQLHYFVCGPTAMTQSAEKWLAALGIRSAQIHSELFEWV